MEKPMARQKLSFCLSNFQRQCLEERVIEHLMFVFKKSRRTKGQIYTAVSQMSDVDLLMAALSLPTDRVTSKKVN
jgi:hypothetical protein